MSDITICIRVMVLIHIAKNSYKFTGKHNRKMSIKIDYIREELLKVVENV